jgi:hypothetical protein
MGGGAAETQAAVGRFSGIPSVCKSVTLFKLLYLTLIFVGCFMFLFVDNVDMHFIHSLDS